MLTHGVPWQAVLAHAFLLIIFFTVFMLFSLVAGYFGLHYSVIAISLSSSFFIIVVLIPLFLNLSRSYFKTLFVLLVVQVFGTIFSFAGLFLESGILASNGEVVNTVRDSIYFSITTFTTLGYGDFRPQPDMRLATSVEALFGMVSMAIGASLIWLWCRENMVPKEMAFFDGNRRHKSDLAIHRMRIRTITGKERDLKDYVLPPKPGEKFRYDRDREEWIELKEGDEIEEGDFVLQRADDEDVDG